METPPSETIEIPPLLAEKWRRLLKMLGDLQSVVVAFSGGVDSALLCAAAHRALGERMMAVTISSPVEPQDSQDAARQLAAQLGFRHRTVFIDELKNPDFASNPLDRCYHCKFSSMGEISRIAQREGYAAVVEGSNLDDGQDYRPGWQAVAEWSVRSPLFENGLTKDEIRALAKALGLPVWNRPSSPCLASRFPYGVQITPEGLRQVAQGEEYLRRLGFSELRVRHHHAIARLEVSQEDIPRLVAEREQITAFFKQLGYRYVTLDLAGFRSGSLNEVLDPTQRRRHHHGREEPPQA